MSTKTVVVGFVAGLAAYYLFKRLRSKNSPAPIKGIGDEAGVYAYMYDVRGKLQKATELYRSSMRKIEDLDMKLAKENGAYAAASDDDKPPIMFRIAEIQRQRDLAVLEAELVIRNVINPLREKLITEDARLKSAVVGPDIAMNRTGSIPSF